jgi:signal transduction histidine kinase
MVDHIKHRPWWITLSFGFLVWTLLGISFALSAYLNAVRDNASVSFKRTLSGYLADFWLWGMLSPLIFRLATRYELRKRFPRNLFIHLAISIFFALIVLSAASPLTWYLGYVNVVRYPTLFILWRNNAFGIYYFHQGLTIYWTTLVVAHALHYYKGLREEEARASNLSAQLAQAQLQALRMQIHPHFLFNTLNSIAALLHKDVETADRMVARLGDFLRSTLKRSEAQTITFDQELEFLKCYLDIERTRFQDRLTVNLQIDPQTLELPVPNLILQPIVENAVRHGIACKSDEGLITVRAAKQRDRLLIEIEDNGPGLRENCSTGCQPVAQENQPRQANSLSYDLDQNGNSGIGLQNTRSRLKQFYGEDFSFQLSNCNGRGVLVSLNIPANKNVIGDRR